mgnify:CR=1 FL=1
MNWQDILKADVDAIDANTKKLIVEEYNRNMKNDIKTKLESKIAEGKIPKISIVVNSKQQDNQMKDGMTGTTYTIGALSHGAMDNANKNKIMQQISPLLNADGYQTSESKLGRGTMTVQLPPEKVKQVKANNPTMMRNLSSKVGNILSRKPKATGQQQQQPVTSTALATTGQQQPIDVEFTETNVRDVNPNFNPKGLIEQDKNRQRLLGQGQ